MSIPGLGHDLYPFDRLDSRRLHRAFGPYPAVASSPRSGALPPIARRPATVVHRPGALQDDPGMADVYRDASYDRRRRRAPPRPCPARAGHPGRGPGRRFHHDHHGGRRSGDRRPRRRRRRAGTGTARTRRDPRPAGGRRGRGSGRRCRSRAHRGLSGTGHHPPSEAAGPAGCGGTAGRGPRCPPHPVRPVRAGPLGLAG